CRFQFRSCDVPVGSAFLAHGTEVLTEIFYGGPAEEPIAVVDLMNDQTWLEDDHVGDHRIVGGIRVFGDVQIFLDVTPPVGEEGQVGPIPAEIFTRLGDIGGADRD